MHRRVVAALTALLIVAFAAPAAADGHESQVTVVHAVPGLTVDVWVNDEPFLEGFEPETVTDEQTLPEDTYEIEIYAAGSDPEEDDPAIAETVELPAGVNASIVAHLDADGEPTLSVFVNDTDETAEGEGRLTVRHVAEAPATDVRAEGDVLVDGLTNGDEGVADVPADTYSADVTLAGEDDAVIGPADVAIEAGTNTIVYAAGSDDFTLLVQTVSGLAGDDDAMPTEVASGQGGLAGSTFPTVLLLALAGLALTALGVGRVAAQRS